MKTKGRACIALYKDAQCREEFNISNNGYTIDVADYDSLGGGATPIDIYAKNIGTHSAYDVVIGEPVNKSFNVIAPNEIKQCSFTLYLSTLDRSTTALEVYLSYDSIKHS